MATKMNDTELLNWAEKHPEIVIRSIEGLWAMYGKGFRENFFGFRSAIQDAIKKNNEKESACGLGHKG